MTAGLIGARDVYTADECRRLYALGDSLRERLNERGRTLNIGFQATGIGGVLTTHWHDLPIMDPRQIEAPDSARRRLFHLELMERGFYIAPRGMINLSLPMVEDDVAGFMTAIGDYMTERADILRYDTQARG